MKNIKRITDLLLALKLLAHQTHLLSVSHADHLLAERIQDGLDSNIDILKEVALYCFDDNSIASCSHTSEGAFNILHDIKTDISIEQAFSYILEIIDQIELECSNKTEHTAMDTVLGDTARDIAQKGYLVKKRLDK